MNTTKYFVRNAKPEEFKTIGLLMVDVYSQLEDFPSPEEQPKYYEMLANIGEQAEKPNTVLLVAISNTGKVGGGVVYFSDMKQYGSGGTATKEKNASGFRLLAVDPNTKGQGIGKLLSLACIEKAKQSGNKQLIIHSTKAMKIAWNMYEKLGFQRYERIDFMQDQLPVFGFRLPLI